ILGYDLAWTAHGGGHHRKTTCQSFDEDYPKRLHTGIRLTENVSGYQQSPDIFALSQQLHAIRNPKFFRGQDDFPQVVRFSRPLRSAHDPTSPARDVA